MCRYTVAPDVDFQSSSRDELVFFGLIDDYFRSGSFIDFRNFKSVGALFCDV